MRADLDPGEGIADTWTHRAYGRRVDARGQPVSRRRTPPGLCPQQASAIKRHGVAVRGDAGEPGAFGRPDRRLKSVVVQPEGDTVPNSRQTVRRGDHAGEAVKPRGDAAVALQFNQPPIFGRQKEALRRAPHMLHAPSPDEVARVKRDLTAIRRHVEVRSEQEAGAGVGQEQQRRFASQRRLVDAAHRLEVEGRSGVHHPPTGGVAHAADRAGQNRPVPAMAEKIALNVKPDGGVLSGAIRTGEQTGDRPPPLARIVLGDPPGLSVPLRDHDLLADNAQTSRRVRLIEHGLPGPPPGARIESTDPAVEQKHPAASLEPGVAQRADPLGQGIDRAGTDRTQGQAPLARPKQRGETAAILGDGGDGKATGDRLHGRIHRRAARWCEKGDGAPFADGRAVMPDRVRRREQQGLVALRNAQETLRLRQGGVGGQPIGHAPVSPCLQRAIPAQPRDLPARRVDGIAHHLLRPFNGHGRGPALAPGGLLNRRRRDEGQAPPRRCPGGPQQMGANPMKPPRRRSHGRKAMAPAPLSQMIEGEFAFRQHDHALRVDRLRVEDARRVRQRGVQKQAAVVLRDEGGRRVVATQVLSGVAVADRPYPVIRLENGPNAPELRAERLIADPGPVPGQRHRNPGVHADKADRPLPAKLLGAELQGSVRHAAAARIVDLDDAVAAQEQAVAQAQRVGWTVLRQRQRTTGADEAPRLGRIRQIEQVPRIGRPEQLLRMPRHAAQLSAIDRLGDRPGKGAPLRVIGQQAAIRCEAQHPLVLDDIAQDDAGNGQGRPDDGARGLVGADGPEGVAAVRQQRAALPRSQPLHVGDRRRGRSGVGQRVGNGEIHCFDARPTAIGPGSGDPGAILSHRRRRVDKPSRKRPPLDGAVFAGGKIGQHRLAPVDDEQTVAATEDTLGSPLGQPCRAGLPQGLHRPVRSQPVQLPVHGQGERRIAVPRETADRLPRHGPAWGCRLAIDNPLHRLARGIQKRAAIRGGENRRYRTLLKLAPRMPRLIVGIDARIAGNHQIVALELREAHLSEIQFGKQRRLLDQRRRSGHQVRRGKAHQAGAEADALRAPAFLQNEERARRPSGEIADRAVDKAIVAVGGPPPANISLLWQDPVEAIGRTEPKAVAAPTGHGDGSALPHRWRRQPLAPVSLVQADIALASSQQQPMPIGRRGDGRHVVVLDGLAVPVEKAVVAEECRPHAATPLREAPSLAQPPENIRDRAWKPPRRQRIVPAAGLQRDQVRGQPAIRQPLLGP